MSEPIGEIIETSTTGFVAQACELGMAPAFGAFVSVVSDGIETFGLVYRVRTGGLEPGAHAVMRGRAGVRDDAIYHENPDLRAVLRTDFAAVIVGFAEHGHVRQYLPSYPPPLHWSVYECSPAAVAAFTNELDYLRALLSAPDVPSEELVAANLRLARQARTFDSDFCVRAGRELARLLSRDYARLSAILRRLSLTPQTPIELPHER
jgi:hypothetical protein